MPVPPNIDHTFFRETSSGRYDQMTHFLKQGFSIWALADEHGCLIIELGKDKVLPVWPTSELARNWGEKAYPDFNPLEITSQDWEQKWLTGMEKDGFSVGISPNLAGECIVSSAKEHLGDITRR